MPILSLIELTFVEGHSIWDHTSPLGKLWESALQYVQSCPGCIEVYYGENIEESASKAVHLIIQWDSIKSHEEYK